MSINEKINLRQQQIDVKRKLSTLQSKAYGISCNIERVNKICSMLRAQLVQTLHLPDPHPGRDGIFADMDYYNKLQTKMQKQLYRIEKQISELGDFSLLPGRSCADMAVYTNFDKELEKCK